MPQIVPCPVCSEEMDVDSVGIHLDRDCHKSNEIQPSLPLTATDDSSPTKAVTPLASIFTPRSRKPSDSHLTASYRLSPSLSSANKRSISAASTSAGSSGANAMGHSNQGPSLSKRLKQGTTAVRDAMPLAEKMRPTTLDGIYGQEDVINLLRSMVSSSRLPSMIFSGGPGCGKTTLARALAKEADCRFLEISGTTSGVKECNQVFEEARGLLTMTGKKTVVFCDEIHRLNTGQQDIFLAPVERGEVTL
jgi:putative ATPase